MAESIPWTRADLDLLVELWPDLTLSRSALAKRLKRSKNAIGRKVRYLDLPARPSPIKRRAADVPPRVRSARGAGASTLPPLASEAGFDQPRK
jgi:GcrA cell cycle regulator